METNFIDEISQKEVIDSDKSKDCAEGITLEQIALLTDFPEDFIKKELLLGEKEISVAEFREKVLEYLEKTIHLLKE